MFFISSSYAVVYEHSSGSQKALVAIGNKGVFCSGSVVGLNPPTIITARHCALANAVRYKGIDPEHVITGEFDQYEFNLDKALMPGDIAILIFSQTSQASFRESMNEHDLFNVKPVSLNLWQKVSICGYGSNSSEYGNMNGLAFSRCGDNSLITDSQQLNFETETQDYSDHFKKLSDKKKVKLLHTTIQANLSEYGAQTRLGIGALLLPTAKTPLGDFDKNHTQTLLQSGDSGGPVFVGERTLIGVNSMALFNDEQVTMAIFWSLEHPWSRELLKRAVFEGADIQGM